MAQPSILQPLSGPLAGQRLEFFGGEASIGSAADCTVRLDLPGVEPHHARITVDITGAMIYRVDGVVGVNDDVVMGDSLLRSGDFVWIGEPAGPDSIMCQFTLGDGEAAPSEAPASEPAAAPVVAEEVMEVVSEDAPPPAAAAEEVLLEETPPEPAFAEPAPEPVEFDEPAPEPASELAEAPVELPAELPEPASEIAEVAPPPEGEYAAPEPVATYSEPEPVPAPVAEFSEPLPDPEPPVATPAEPVLVEPPADMQEMMEVAPEPQTEFDPGETFETAPTPEPATVTGFPPASPPPSVPPAPWLAPAVVSEPAPAAEYASAWEAKPAAEPAPAVEAPPPPPPTPAPRPAAAARPATPTSPLKRPATPSSKSAIRTVQQDAVLRTPPPPPPGRGTSSTPIIIVGLIAVVLLIGGVMFMRQTPAPAPPPPTPQPTAIAVATPEPTPAEPVGEPTPEATVEPTPEPPPAATPAGPTPRVATTPTPRGTPTPRTTPTPTPRTAAATPPPAPTVAAPVAPVSPVPRLLDEARAAVSARDLQKAQQLLGEALRAEPGNSEATARKAEVDARVALLGKRFSTGATSVIGGKTTKGPSGFDLGGGGVVKTDFSAQIRCTTTPTSVEPGTPYTVRCSILNIGTKAFRLENVTVNETADGAKTPGAGTTPRGDLDPQSDSVIFEKSGTWSAKAWSLEVITKTTKDESFRAVYNWR